jgi:sulfur carrier protein ThiS
MARVVMGEKVWEIKRRLNVLRFLQREGINPEEVLVLINGRVVTEDTVMEPDDQVVIKSVLSKG